MPEMAQIFTEKSCMPNRRILFNVQLLGQYWGHVWAIIRPCQGHFWTIPSYSQIISTTATLLELAKFCFMDTLDMFSDILQPGGLLETPGLVHLDSDVVTDV